MLEGMLVQAATSCELSTVWDGLTWLERAIAAAAEERCLRPFREGGRPVRALLQVLARRGPWPPVGFVAELLDDGPAAGPAAPLPGTSPLSERERAILRYLPSRLEARDRRRAGRLGQHRQDPRQLDLPQARRRLASRGDRPRACAGPAGERARRRAVSPAAERPVARL